MVRWWWAQSIRFSLLSLARLAYSTVACSARSPPSTLSAPPLREQAHYTTTRPLLPLPLLSPPRIGPPLLFRSFSELFSGFGVGAPLRGRLGCANGCPSLRLGWGRGASKGLTVWGLPSHVAVGRHQGDRFGGLGPEPFWH